MRKRPHRGGPARGFVLPLAVLLAIVLSISGAALLQHDLGERLQVMRVRDELSAFYLASAGLERARTTIEAGLTQDGKADWSAVLAGTSVHDATLCPFEDGTRPCVVPPFQLAALNPTVATDGAAVTAPDAPFGGTFANCADCSYSVRVYNNLSEGATDEDGKIVIRAVGQVRGQHKLLEATIGVASNQDLINCLNSDLDAPCPDSKNPNASLLALPGREPSSVDALPTWNQAYYQNPANLPCTSAVTLPPAVTTLIASGANPSNASEVPIASNTCYFTNTNLTVQSIGTGYHDIVVFTTGALQVSGNVQFASDTVLIGGTSVQLQGSVETHAPRPMPAIISGGEIVKGNLAVQIYGSIYAVGSIGSEQHPWNPNEVHGAIMGDDVWLKAASTMVTDDGDESYYDFMPGFIYPKSMKRVKIIDGTWQEWTL